MKKKLLTLEKERDINILYSCESGSRAWGFASKDSDYDVRFIYAEPLEWYLKVSEGKDSIAFIDGDFDASGWELRKFLRQLKKSNVPALEHLFSPIVYMQRNCINELRSIASDCFSPINTVFHYQSMSKKYIEKIDEDVIKLKDLFYALRTILASKWVFETQSFPPVTFSEMFLLLNDSEQQLVKELMVLKSEEKEQKLHPKPVLLFNYIQKQIVKHNQYAKSLPSGNPDHEQIDTFLYNTLI